MIIFNWSTLKLLSFCLKLNKNSANIVVTRKPQIYNNYSFKMKGQK